MLHAMRRILSDLGGLQLLVLGFTITLVSIVPSTQKKRAKTGGQNDPHFWEHPGAPTVGARRGSQKQALFWTPFFDPQKSGEFVTDLQARFRPHCDAFLNARAIKTWTHKHEVVAVVGLHTRHGDPSWIILYQSKIHTKTVPCCRNGMTPCTFA